MVVQNLDMHFSVQTNMQFKIILEEINLNLTSKVFCILSKITLKGTQEKGKLYQKWNLLLSILNVYKLTQLLMFWFIASFFFFLNTKKFQSYNLISLFFLLHTYQKFDSSCNLY